MRKRIVTISMVAFLLVACASPSAPSAPKTTAIDFADEGPFVELRLYSAEAGTYLDHFPKKITISNDGTVRLFTEEKISRTGTVEMKVGDDAPTIEKNISLEEVEKIKQVIKENRFSSMPKDVMDDDVMDGDGSEITVYGKKQEKKVGGENSSNEPYNEVEEIIFAQVEDEFEKWVEETEQYLFELNGDGNPYNTEDNSMVDRHE